MYVIIPITFIWIALKPQTSGPECKQMVDMTSGHTFLASAFEPTEEEIEDAVRDRRAARRTGAAITRRKAVEPVKAAKAETRRFSNSWLQPDDSDDDLPDAATLFHLQTMVKNEPMVVKPETNASEVSWDSEHANVSFNFCSVHVPCLRTGLTRST